MKNKVRDRNSSYAMKLMFRLRDQLPYLTDEEHDFIVYRINGEFDPNDFEAKRYISDRIMHQAYGVGEMSDEYKAKRMQEYRIVPAVTMDEYLAFLEKTGKRKNEKIVRSIEKREAREEKVMAERGMIYVPEPGILDKLVEEYNQYMIKEEIEVSNWDTVKYLGLGLISIIIMIILAKCAMQ